ncbi:MAG: cysteine hydrolase [bacterium]|nr:cysteine hydrolase [bacterium]
MKKVPLYLALFILTALLLPAQQSPGKKESPKTALLLIDIQDFYFPGAPYALVQPETAALNAQKLLLAFRLKKKTIVHVRHNSPALADIHKSVVPIAGEKVISKDFANSFRGTDLLQYFKQQGIKRLVICGMMTHMCVEAATRAAADYGFSCIVVADACATKDLEFNGKAIPAQQVHLSTLASLSGSYAEIKNTADYLKQL